jgi:hypothetical protein
MQLCRGGAMTGNSGFSTSTIAGTGASSSRKHGLRKALLLSPSC